ncbi:MAG: hypothetical protein FD138_2488 [Planctomycetota bacterium]|nr:MAG: hypothetical protein FD138_2488 [Planctomycetota bacterium]
MKNILAKLKGLLNKQAAIDHGEKLFLGVIALFVLFCLGTTSWSRYDKQPTEFLVKVEAGEKNIQNSAFSLEEQNKFKPLNIMAAVQTLQSPLEPGNYEYSTKFFWPMYPTAIKITEPKWLAPIAPMADFGKAVIVELPPEQSSAPTMVTAIEGSDAAKKLAAANSSDDDEFAPRRPAGDATGRAGVDATGAAANPKAPGGAGGGAYKQMLGAGAMPGMDGMMDGMSGSGGPTVNAQGNRFVSVRAVYPLGDQLDELAKAMHEQQRQKAAEFVNFLDFEVQRQVAQPGDQTWSGPWEQVDLQATLDLMDRIEFDADLVDPAYTDNVFTMPLPRRVIGSWRRWASHPLIKTLTDEQAEVQAQLNAKVIEEAEKRKLDDKTTKKGFASRVHDTRGLRNTFMGGGQMTSMMSDLTNQMKNNEMAMFNPGVSRGDGTDGMMGMMSGLSNEMSRPGYGRTSKYLLFRYFDFQVTPGNAYRYRVRMTLLNPNFKRPVEELVDESIAAGEVRVTPWSEPTPHVFVPEEQRMFLAKAEKAKADTGLPSAQIDVYQWFSEAGTTIAAKVEKLQLGQFISGPCKDTEVYRPAQDTLKKEEVPVFTGSLLADLAVAPTTTGFDSVEHADLKLDDKKIKQLTTADKALVVDRYGQMAILDSKGATDERTAAERILENERRSIRERLKNRPETNTAGGGLGGLIPRGDGTDGADDPMMMQMQMMMQQGMGGGNSQKRGAKPALPKKPADSLDARSLLGRAGA